MRAQTSPNGRRIRSQRYRRQVTVLVAGLLVALFGTAVLAPATASAEGENYTIATDTTFAPFEFQDKQGKFVGIDMDLIRAIAEDQDFTVDIKPLGFDAALQAVQANQVDGVIAGMSITDERKKVFDFSEPYFESGIQMAVLEDQRRHQVLRRPARASGSRSRTAPRVPISPTRSRTSTASRSSRSPTRRPCSTR